MVRYDLSHSLPRVVIVGGGFAGLAAAKALRETPAQITVIDVIVNQYGMPQILARAEAIPQETRA